MAGENTVKRTGNLFPSVVSFAALNKAAWRAYRANRDGCSANKFMENLEPELLTLQRQLVDGRYSPGNYITFTIRDPKVRVISAAPFRDRVVHHALCAVLEPLFERRYIYDSYACRCGKGTHKAVKRAA